MGIFTSFSPRQIVPIDSTLNEVYVLRCLQRSVKQADPAFLTSALHAVAFAVQHYYAVKDVTADVLLDTLVPVIHTKCRPTKLQRALLRLQETIHDDANGVTGFSLCIFHSATLTQPTGYAL